MALQRQLAEAELFDALVCPTTAIPGLPAGDDPTAFRIGKAVEHFRALDDGCLPSARSNER